MVCKNKRLPFGSKDYKDYIQISTVDLLSSQISTVHYLSLHISIFNIFTPSFITHNSSLSIQNLHTHTHTLTLVQSLGTYAHSGDQMAAPLQQSPITIKSRSSPSPQFIPTKTHTLSFSGGLRIPKLTLAVKSRRRGGARMSASVASSYATALADVANSNGTLDATAADLEKISNLFSEESVYRYFINPTVPVESKNELVDSYTKEANLLPHIANFLNVLIDMKRIDQIKEITEEFELVYNKITETELAIVTSVVKLDAQHLAQIAKGVQKLTGAKNVRIKTALNESLVAGFTIRYGSGGSKLIDMSVKKQLEEIAETLEVGDLQLV